ncbi:MAG: sigma 54-interacting transcriptional regulator [Terracidiphilus sp.]
MQIECALFYRAESPLRITIDSPSALRESVGIARLPAAVVVRAVDLLLFEECPHLFKDRDQKNEHKGLSTLLLGQGERIPFIFADFTADGRLRQSVDKLLENAKEAGEFGIYVIGVNEEVFKDAWRSAVPEDESRQPVASEQPLLQLLTPLPGEAQLSRTFWGDSEDYHLVRQLILRAASIDDPVLILGETGTGKGVAARAIHDLGRRDKPFVEVNCAAIPSELFESELFGYVPGAFTGALKAGKKGLWEVARDGTLFLDEIGDLRLDHQAKILHTLQVPKIRRLGAETTLSVFARVIAATNRNLRSMVESGEFREDLYYRLRQFLIPTPDLRDDPRNLELIAQEVWREITRTTSRLPDEILEDLCRHRWPGNVRELRSVLGSLKNFFGTSDLKREHLNAVFQHFGLVAGYGLRDVEPDDSAVLQVECLKKIRRADDAIHACERELKPLADGLPLAAAARDSLLRLRVEMQALIRNRLYFGSQETYQSVERVEENLGQLLGMPRGDARALDRFWRNTLAPVIQQAVARLFAEVQRLRT